MTTYNIIGYSMMAFGTLGMIWRLFWVDKVHQPRIEFVTAQDALAMYANSVTYKSNNDYVAYTDISVKRKELQEILK